MVEEINTYVNSTLDTNSSSVDCFDYVSKAYLVYGSNVNTSRAFPSIYDGLKPVQRKLILSSNEVASNKEVSSANIVGQCFTGDTEILDINNKRIKITDLIELNNSGKPVYTFSCDCNGNISTTRITNVWKSESSRPLIKVEIDSGECVRCTDDHKFMLRDGSYKNAKDLNINDLLMSVDITEYSDNQNSSKSEIRKNKNIDTPYNKFPKVVSHKVMSVTPCEIEDVYDIEVDSVNHNFLLGIGVFVHNCISFYHPHGDCLLGSTQVLLANHSSATIEDLTILNKPQKVFSIDKKGNITESIAHSFREVKKDNLWCIKFSDGGIIHCSNNHPILLRTGKYVCAESLKPGDLVFSLDIYKGEFSYTLSSVVSVDCVAEEEIILYDFTVDNYENMLVKTGKNTLLCVHNSGVYKAMVNMINAEDPVLSGHGAFGYRGGLVEIDAAHMRYTAAGLNKFGSELFCEYLDFVEKEENELYNKEPKYLPTPIPYALLNGSSGIGLGAITSIPACTIESLKNWISKYLETGKMDEVIIPKYSFNKEVSELDKFNKTGVGTFQFFSKVEKSKDKKSVLISDFPTYISPSRLLKEFKIELQSRIVTIVQLNDSENKPLVKVEKAPHTRSINIDDIYNRVKKCMTKNVSFKSVVTDGKKAYIFGPQDWLKFTVDCYSSFVNFGLRKELEKLEESILFNTVKNDLANLFLQKMSNEEIVQSLNNKGFSVTIDNINRWSRKSISTLRSDELSIDDLTKKSEEIKNHLSNINKYTLNKILKILK